MANKLKTLADIPTLTALYRTRVLPASKATGLPETNQKFNDTISTIQYDITQLKVDAIVNAANVRLLGGGGVDHAIHKAAGPGLVKECATLHGCDTGSAKITKGYKLPAKHVIHAVGPVFRDYETSEPLLRGCYRTCLELAAKHGCKSIAFSAISTGVYGYPSDDAAIAAINEVRSFLEGSQGSKIERVIFCNFQNKDVKCYSEYLPEVFPPTEEDIAAAKQDKKMKENGAAAEQAKKTKEDGAAAKQDKKTKEDNSSGEAATSPSRSDNTNTEPSNLTNIQPQAASQGPHSPSARPSPHPSQQPLPRTDDSTHQLSDTGSGSTDRCQVDSDVPTTPDPEAALFTPPASQHDPPPQPIVEHQVEEDWDVDAPSIVQDHLQTIAERDIEELMMLDDEDIEEIWAPLQFKSTKKK